MTRPKTSKPARQLTQAQAEKIMYRSAYRTGDGEAPAGGRPGSQDHEAIPSRIGKVRVYRDGRREAV